MRGLAVVVLVVSGLAVACPCAGMPLGCTEGSIVELPVAEPSPGVFVFFRIQGSAVELWRRDPGAVFLRAVTPGEATVQVFGLPVAEVRAAATSDQLAALLARARAGRPLLEATYRVVAREAPRSFGDRGPVAAVNFSGEDRWPIVLTGQPRPAPTSRPTPRPVVERPKREPGALPASVIRREIQGLERERERYEKIRKDSLAQAHTAAGSGGTQFQDTLNEWTPQGPRHVPTDQEVMRALDPLTRNADAVSNLTRIDGELTTLRNMVP